MDKPEQNQHSVKKGSRGTLDPKCQLYSMPIPVVTSTCHCLLRVSLLL